jgi:hypothetical protein
MDRNTEDHKNPANRSGDSKMRIHIYTDGIPKTTSADSENSPSLGESS